MRSHALTRFSLVALLLLGLTACGVGKRQSPVASDDEAGLTKPVQIEEEKPSIYVTKAGDKLSSIAGRDEIYGEPDLWPLILDANQGTLGEQTGRSKLAPGISLAIPRGLDDAALADAREKARQAAASVKAAPKPKTMEAPVIHREKAKPVTVAKAVPTPKPEVKAPAKPAKAVKSSKGSVKEGASDAKPVPKAKRSGGLMPVLFFLLLLLAVLAAVLFYFTRRDQKDSEG